MDLAKYYQKLRKMNRIQEIALAMHQLAQFNNIYRVYYKPSIDKIVIRKKSPRGLK